MFKTETLKDCDVWSINDLKVGLLLNSALVKCAVAGTRWDESLFRMSMFCGVVFGILGVSEYGEKVLFDDYQEDETYKNEAVTT